MQTKIGGVQQEELEEALALPAHYANRILVTPIGLNARISFLEILSLADGTTQPFGRVAALVSLPDLIALRDVINHVIAGMGVEEPPQGG